jgi:HD-GYP domain-containing protein (c-di-GMP phosphodiesterase class II)
LRAQAELSSTIAALLDEGTEARLTVVGDYLFLDESRLRVDAVGFAAFDHMVGTLRAHGVGEIHILALPAPDEITTFVRAFLEPAGEADPFDRLLGRLGGLKECILLRPLPPGDLESESEKDPRERARRAFLGAVAVTRAAMARTRVGKPVDFRAAQRVVQSVVDLLLEEEFSLLGLTVLRDYDAYTFHHSVNVCILSIVLGKRLGLSRRELNELGVAALFHDIGKVTLPRALLDKPGRFDESEWRRMKRHPAEGARLLLRLGGMGRLVMQSVLVAFEHHQRHDLSGYPAGRIPRPQHLFSRIVAIADCFDAMGADRPYREKPLRREEILGHIMVRAGSHFDPVLVKILANAVGVYPVGTVLVLGGGVWALVIGSAPPDAPDRPLVRVVRDASGGPADGPEINLAHSAVAVLGTVDPDEHGLDLSRFFL